MTKQAIARAMVVEGGSALRRRNPHRPLRPPGQRARRKIRTNRFLRNQAEVSDRPMRDYVGRDKTAAIALNNFSLVTFARISFSNMWVPKATR